MLVLLILLAYPSAPPDPETPRWNPNVGIPAGGPWGVSLKSATNSMLNDPDPKIRRSAARAIGFSSDPSVVPSLLKAFQDNDAEVRKQAAGRFSSYPDPRAIEPLIKLLHDPDASVRNETLIVVQRFEDPRFVPPMLAVLRDSKETADNRWQAASGLRFSHDRRAADAYLAVLKDHSAPPSVRSEVAEGLRYFGDGRAVEPLIALLTDRSQPLLARIGAARALARFGDRRSTTLMIQIAKSDGPRGLRFWGAIGAAKLTGGTIDDIDCITPIIDSYHVGPFGGDLDHATKCNALATIIEHAKDQSIRLAAARMLCGIGPNGPSDPLFGLHREEPTAAERDIQRQLELGDQALRERKLNEARLCFERSEKLLAQVTNREHRVDFHAQAICALAAIAETQQRWSKLTPAEIAAEREGVDALRGKAKIYYRGDPYVMHDARPTVPPSVPIGSDSLVEGLIAEAAYTNNPFRDADIKHLEKMPGLRMLSLAMSKTAPPSLVHIRGLKNLEYLSLPDTVTDADLPLLLGFPRLIVLRLQGKGITDEGLKYVARLQGLTRLGLGGTAITDAGLKSVTSLRQLRELSLCSTQISDAGLEPLAGMTQLQEVCVVNGARVTSQGVEKLEKALPNCIITRHTWP
jgi:HEAT repeat protein